MFGELSLDLVNANNDQFREVLESEAEPPRPVPHLDNKFYFSLAQMRPCTIALLVYDLDFDITWNIADQHLVELIPTIFPPLFSHANR